MVIPECSAPVLSAQERLDSGWWFMSTRSYSWALQNEQMDSTIDGDLWPLNSIIERSKNSSQIQDGDFWALNSILEYSKTTSWNQGGDFWALITILEYSKKCRTHPTLSAQRVSMSAQKSFWVNDFFCIPVKTLFWALRKWTLSTQKPATPTTQSQLLRYRHEASFEWCGFREWKPTISFKRYYKEGVNWVSWNPKNNITHSQNIPDVPVQ